MKKIIIAVLAIIILVITAYFIARSPVARSMNEKGLMHYKANNFALAETYFTKALNWKKNYADALINLVKSQLEQDKLADARKSVDRLISVVPDHAETFGLQGQLLVMEKQYSESIGKLSAAIAADSLLAYPYFYRAIAYANLDSLEAAAQDYLKAQQLDKQNIQAFEKGAIVLGRLENFEAAIQNYDKVIELDPSNIDAFFKRGTFKMKINDYKGAIADLDKVLKLKPGFPEAYFNRGTAYAYTDQLENAIADFNKSAGMNFKTAKALYNSGLASYRLMHFDDALKYLEKSIRADVSGEYTSQAYYIMGATEMMRNKTSKAIEYFNESIRIDTNSADAYYNRAIAFGTMKEYQKAIQDLDKCINLGKKTSDVYYARGVQHISLNNFPAGCSDISEAVKLGNQQAVAIQQQYCK